MKFSIVIPVYNVKAYVEECIESVLQQTYRNFEIILVDDGSTDDSGVICDNYARMYEGIIRVFHNRNQGQFFARKYGAEKATGDVILFADADDCIRRDALELLQNKFEEVSCDMIIYNLSRERDFSVEFHHFPYEDGQCFSGNEKKELYELLITTRKLNSLALKAVKTEIVKVAQNEYPKGMRIVNGEDLLQSLPMFTMAQKVCYLKQNLYFYRLRADSITNTYNPQIHRSIKAVHTEIEKYIELWGMPTAVVKNYTKTVCSWVVCMEQWMRNRKRGLSDDSFDRILYELSEDGYFRNAYENMDKSALSKKEIVLSKWLYEKKYGMIKSVGALLRTARALKRRIKG